LRCHQCANIAGLIAKLLCQMRCNLFSVISKSSYNSIICSHTSRMCWAFQNRANPDFVRTRRVDKGDGKTKSHVAAMATLRRLARPRTALYQRYAKTKEMQEEEKMSECSFKPIVGRRPDPDSPLALPIFDRISESKQRIDLRKRVWNFCLHQMGFLIRFEVRTTVVSVGFKR